jgi:peptide/nickel transport system substrate-binding protein
MPFPTDGARRAAAPLALCRAIPVAMLAAALAAGLAPSRAEAQAANRNVVIVLPDEPVELDACMMDNSYNGRILKQNIAETLTELDPDTGGLKPRLALSWEKVNDTTWRFKLREGVMFTDGVPFNATTAAQSIERTMSKELITGADGKKAGLPCSTRNRYFATVSFAGKAIDPTTLEVTADQPVPILPLQMSVLGLVSPNQPKDKLTNEPVGTGPYLFDHWTAGQEVVLKRNPKYWGEKPQVEQATFIWRNESSVRAAMVKIGEADFAPVIAPQEATDPKLDVSYLNAETSWLKIDTATAPLDDVRVRRALNYAVDRGALRGTIFPKDVLPATQLVIPAIAGHNHEIDKKVWPYDPAKAKQLIAEAKAAGTPVDKEIQIIGRINIYPNAQEAMEAMAGMFSAVGLNIRLQMLEVAQWTSINRRPFKEGRPPVLLQTMHDNNIGDPVFSVNPRYGCEGISANLCNPEVERLTKLASQQSGEERVKTWQQLLGFLYEEVVPDVNMFHMVGYSRVGPRIDFKPTVATNSELQISQMKFK